jgi:hypothetical protein
MRTKRNIDFTVGDKLIIVYHIATRDIRTGEADDFFFWRINHDVGYPGLIR